MAMATWICSWRFGSAEHAPPNTGGKFVDIAPALGLNDSRRSVGAVWFDYDEDGDLDLYVGNMDGDANGLFRNDGDKFTDVAEAAGVAWGGRSPSDGMNGTVRPCAADFDNDGRLDLFMANYGKLGLFSMWRRPVQDVSPAGLPSRAVTTCIAGDFDNDEGSTSTSTARSLAASATGTTCCGASAGVRGVTPEAPNASGVSRRAVGGFRSRWRSDPPRRVAADATHSFLRNMLPEADAWRSLDSGRRRGRPGDTSRCRRQSFCDGTRGACWPALVDSGSGYSSQNDMPVRGTCGEVRWTSVSWPANGRRHGWKK
jgi:hypothetical protein